MVELWEEHLSYEFEAHSTEKTMSTMTEDPVNINVPLLTGGVGVEEVRKYYSEYFIPKNPPDTEVTLLSRTVGEDRLVDELIQTATQLPQSTLAGVLALRFSITAVFSLRLESGWESPLD
jgi:carboxymethylenebutenolidase